MATDRTDGDSLMGFLIPDDRLIYWAAQSLAVTEAEPYSGAVTAQRATSAHLTASGTPEDADTLQLYAVQGGITGYDGARFVWRAGKSGDYYGYDVPKTLADFEVPGFTSSIYGYRHPAILPLSDGRILIAVDAPTNSPIQAHRIQYIIRATDGTYSSWLTLHTEAVPSSLSADYLHPVLVDRGAGVIELYHITYKSGSAQLRRWTSTTGDSWDLDTTVGLDDALSISSQEVRGLAVCYGAGQWLAQIWLDDRSDLNDEIKVYASRDGARMELQGTIDNESRPACAWMPVQGRFVTASRLVTGGHATQLREAGSAFSSSLTADADVTGSNGRRDDELAIAVAENGRGYILERTAADAVQLRIVEGTITAQTPAEYGYLMSGDQESYAEFSASFYRGQLLVASNNDEGSPNSAAVAWHGGYSTLTLPDDTGRGYTPTSGPLDWDLQWLPVDELDRGGSFTLTTTGSPANAAAGEYQSSTGAIGEESTYTDLQSLTVGAGLTCLVRAKVNSSASQYSASAYASNVLGSYRYGVEIRLTGGATDTLAVYDAVSGSSIASVTLTTTAGSTWEVLAAVDSSGNCRLWYRQVLASNQDRAWLDLANSGSLTQDNSSTDAAKNGLVIQATSTGAASAYDVSLGLLAYKRDISVADVLIDNPANPDDLRGRALVPRETYIHDGVSVRAAGLVRGGDSWLIEPGHTYALEHALPTTEPSPARGWRSTGTGAASLAFLLDSIDDAHLGPLIGIYLDAHNLDEITIQTSTGVAGSVTWTDRFSGALSLGAQTYQRAGSTLLPRAIGDADEDKIYLLRGELDDAWVEFRGVNKPRQIVRNTEGNWAGGAAAPQWPALQLAGVDDTEPSSGAVSASDGLVIHPRRTLILLYAAAGWREISGIRLQIAGNATPPQGYWEIGTLAIGAVHALGWRPDSTRSRALALGEVLETQPDGSAYARRQRADLRRCEIAWTRSSPSFERLGNDQDYVTAQASSLPVAARWLGPQSFRGVLREVGRTPIVYVPRIPHLASGADRYELLIEREAEGAMLCRFVPESYRLESVGTQLPEEAGELLRTSVITLEECV